MQVLWQVPDCSCGCRMLSASCVRFGSLRPQHLPCLPLLSQGAHQFDERVEDIVVGPGGQCLVADCTSSVTVLRSAPPVCSMGAGLACVQISATEVRGGVWCGRGVTVWHRVRELEYRSHSHHCHTTSVTTPTPTTQYHHSRSHSHCYPHFPHQHTHHPHPHHHPLTSPSPPPPPPHHHPPSCRWTWTAGATACRWRRACRSTA